MEAKISRHEADTKLALALLCDEKRLPREAGSLTMLPPPFGMTSGQAFERNVGQILPTDQHVAVHAGIGRRQPARPLEQIAGLSCAALIA